MGPEHATEDLDTARNYAGIPLGVHYDIEAERVQPERLAPEREQRVKRGPHLGVCSKHYEVSLVVLRNLRHASTPAAFRRLRSTSSCYAVSRGWSSPATMSVLPFTSRAKQGTCPVVAIQSNAGEWVARSTWWSHMDLRLSRTVSMAPG